MAENIFAAPKTVTHLEDCYFYHSMEIPGWGEVRGEWDLRGREKDYIGNVNLKGKRVLEIGVASGFLSFYMERQGAEVIGYDLSENHEWDMLPVPPDSLAQVKAGVWSHIKKVNNAYWLAHRSFNSKSKVVYGTVYDVPEEIGLVDVTTLCAVLLHVRDPFRALQQTLRLTRETVVVTDLFRDPRSRLYNVFPTSLLGKLAGRFHRKFGGPSLVFMPPYAGRGYAHTWWYLSPEVIRGFLTVLGFGETKVTYHLQRYVDGQYDTLVKMYTVVGRRSESLTAHAQG